MRSLVLAALLAIGCAESAPAAPTLPLPEPEAPAPSCQVTFSPDPGLEALVSSAAARWSRATGCDVLAAAGGIPVRLVPADADVLWNAAEGHYGAGRTYAEPTPDGGEQIAIAIPADFADRNPYAVMHEMGHALARSLGHVEGSEALMTQFAGAGRITADDLVYVCARLACVVFQPE